MEARWRLPMASPTAASSLCLLPWMRSRRSAPSIRRVRHLHSMRWPSIHHLHCVRQPWRRSGRSVPSIRRVRRSKIHCLQRVLRPPPPTPTTCGPHPEGKGRKQGGCRAGREVGFFNFVWAETL
jgi:hypothetical protein